MQLAWRRTGREGSSAKGMGGPANLLNLGRNRFHTTTATSATTPTSAYGQGWPLGALL